MPRTVSYRIIDRPDGRFAVVATLGPGRTYRRDDLPSLAEAEAWVEGLRVLMAACGAPVVRAATVSNDPALADGTGDTDAPDPGRPPRQSFVR